MSNPFVPFLPLLLQPGPHDSLITLVVILPPSAWAVPPPSKPLRETPAPHLPACINNNSRLLSLKALFPSNSRLMSSVSPALRMLVLLLLPVALLNVKVRLVAVSASFSTLRRASASFSTPRPKSSVVRKVCSPAPAYKLDTVETDLAPCSLRSLYCHPEQDWLPLPCRGMQSPSVCIAKPVTDHVALKG